MANFPKGANVPATLPTTVGGRLYIRHIHDLFSTLVVSLTLKLNRQFFKIYPNSFTSDEAVTNIASLKFSQSTRTADPNDRSKVRTVTTTTSFSMNKDAAKGILQQMLDAKLFENAADMAATAFKDRCLWVLTPKGLDVLRRFMVSNNIHAPNLMTLCESSPFASSNPILYLPRRINDDTLDFTNKPVIEAVFRRFAGLNPPANFSNPALNLTLAAKKAKASRTVTLAHHQHVQVQQLHGAGTRSNSSSQLSLADGLADFIASPGVTLKRHAPSGSDHTFTSMSAVDWLEDFSSIHGLEEASTMCAHWVRMGLIGPIDSTPFVKAKAGEFIVRLRDAGEPDADFKASDKVLYRIEPPGVSLAWSNPSATPAYLLPRDSFSTHRSSTSIDEVVSSELQQMIQQTTSVAPSNQTPVTTPNPNAHRTPPASTSSSPVISPSKSSTTGSSGSKTATPPAAQVAALNASTSSTSSSARENSNAAKLHRILEEPALRSLFRQHMRDSFCEENLSFWLDVEDLKRRYASSSTAGVGSGSRGGQGMQSQLEKHQQELMDLALIIYTTYLAPSSPSEINVHSTLRNELISYLTLVLASEFTSGHSSAGRNKPHQPTRGALALHPRQPAANTSARATQANQLQVIVGLYERAQRYIFKGMAADSVPKFCQTERVMRLMRTIADYESSQVTVNSLYSDSYNSEGSDVFSGASATSTSPTRRPATRGGMGGGGGAFLAGLGYSQRKASVRK